MQKNETRSLSHTIHKFNSKWTKDLNEKLETIKLVQENTGETLEDMGMGNNYLGRTKGLSNKRK
jgi:hypothetical protein